MTEIWKDIPCVSGYQASSMGRIRHRERILRQCISRGYAKASPCVDGVWKQMPAHRLVAAAFHGLPNKGLECNHINGDKLDNRPGNLEWVTKSENVLHAFRLGLRVPPCAGSPGEKNGRAKLTELQVRSFLTRNHNGESAYSLSRVFGISYCQAKKIAAGRAWRFLTEEPTSGELRLEKK